MDYKFKYLKYKNKYLDLKKQYGGAKTTHKTTLQSKAPKTHSNIFMPIILAPFENVNVAIEEDIERTLRDNNAPTFADIIELLKAYYVKQRINLSNVWNLSALYYFDVPPFHIRGSDQEKILFEGAQLDMQIQRLFLCIYGSDTRDSFTGKKITIEIIDNIYDKDISCWNVKYDDNFHGDTIIRNIKIASVNTENYRVIHQKLTEHEIDVVVRDQRDRKWTNKTQALIVFGGYAEKHNSLQVILNNYNGYVIYFRDKYNEWYSRSISAFISFIQEYAGRIDNYIFYGRSMGGYAALHASVYFPEKNCICVAIVPQTINHKKYRNKIAIKSNADLGMRNKHGDPPLIQSANKIYKDIPTILTERTGYNTKIYIMIGKSECDDYGANNQHLNLDMLHVGAVINYDNVSSIIYNVASHRLSERINFGELLNVISSNFTTLYRSQELGNNVLSEKINEIST